MLQKLFKFFITLLNTVIILLNTIKKTRILFNFNFNFMIYLD